MCAPVLLQVRHRRAEAALPAAHLPAATTSGARAIRSPASGSDLASLRTAAVRQRRPLRRQRPEDLDHASRTSPTGSSASCAPTPRGGAQAGRHLVPADRHEDARHHGAPADPDGRRPRGERGVLRRRQGAGREPRARRRQGLDGRQVPARPRAHEHRAHRHVAARAREAEGVRRAAAEGRQAADRRPALSRPALARSRSS